MTSNLKLLPYPQRLILTGGTLTIPDGGMIGILTPSLSTEAEFTAQQASAALAQVTGGNWQIAANDTSAVVRLGIDSEIAREQGYRLIISENGVRIDGHDQAGLYYGVMTFKQLLQVSGRVIPQMTIEDWPDFSARGVMLDISRDNVPTMDTLYKLIDMFGSWKINQLQLYTEHTFAYQKHTKVWQNASPITAEEVRLLDAYCRERFIEFVPNQNSFGHMNRWFEHDEYLHLAENKPGSFKSWYFPMQTPLCLSPAVAETIPFLDELFGELLPNFTSQQFNVNCDETFDLGLGKSKALVEAKGKGRVYLDYLLDIYKLVTAHGRKMQYWGDIITQYPDLIPELPKDAIALDWGYDVNGHFPENTKMFADSGVPFYVCPGTSAWWSILGRSDNCIGNIKEAAEYGMKNGAVGILNTDWGDTAGYRHYLPVSYLGFVAGAAYTWSLSANNDADMPALLNTFVFQDQAEIMGNLVYDLGNAYQQTGIISRDGSLLYSLYTRPLSELREGMLSGIRRQESFAILADDQRLTAQLHQTVDYINDVIGRLGNTRMTCDDADLITREYTQMARLATHGAKLGLYQTDPGSISREEIVAGHETILAEYDALWLARSRTGGLADSRNRIEKLHQQYVELVLTS